jgi:hypothetical protein
MVPCPPDPACATCRGEARLDWSFADAVYCISLASREDRARLAARELHRVGLCTRTLFHRPERHPTKVIEGIWESHRAVARHARAHGRKAVLILEDDVAFARWLRPATLRAVARSIGSLPPDWTIFFLGHWPLRARFVARNRLATASACAHAYVASPRLLDWLEDNAFSKTRRNREQLAGGGIDAAYARLPGTFAHFPMLAVQAVRGSDHMDEKKRTKPVRKARHLVTRTDLGEYLLSFGMRPNEMLIAAAALVGTGADWAKAQLARRGRS